MRAARAAKELPMDLGIAGRVALVCGGSKGLGRATADALAAEGAKVAVCARGEANVHAAAKELARRHGVEAIGIPGDLSCAADCARVVAQAAERFGALHIVVSNAGGPPVDTFERLSDEQWMRGVDLTLLSTVRVVRAALPHLRRAKWGRILTIASIAAKQPVPDLVLSSVLRPGMLGLAKSIAADLAKDGILINTICPGYFRTERQEELTRSRAEGQGISREAYLKGHLDQIPLGRYGEPRELGEFAAFLCSEKASYLTGATLSLDGGATRGLL